MIQKNEKKLIIATGNIGSGKSTLAKQAVKLGYVSTGRDMLRYMVGAGDYVFDTSLEPTIARMELACVDELMREGYNVYIDEVGMTARTRGRYIGLAKQYGYVCGSLVLPALSKKICVDRRMQCRHGKFSRKVWESIWDKFNFIYEPPSMHEGFAFIYYIKLNEKRPVLVVDRYLSDQTYSTPIDNTGKK